MESSFILCHDSDNIANNGRAHEMNMEQLHTVTIFYYQESTFEILSDVRDFPDNGTGRVIIPPWYKEGKCIIAVCEGRVTCYKQQPE